MKAVILCAKKKEDMFPFSETKPTGLLPVMGEPLVEHLITDLKSIGVKEVILVTNHLESEFNQKYDDRDKVEIVHQENLTGTAEALRTCKFIEEDFFVVNGDVTVSKNDLNRLKEKHSSSNSKATILADSEDKPEKFGVLSITNDKIEELIEKPEDPDNILINTGIYLLSNEIFDELEDSKDEKSLTKVMKSFVETGDARFELIEDYWIDIGSSRKLLKADRIKREYHLNQQRISDSAEIHESAVISEYADIGENAVIEANAVIEGQTVIRDNCRIRPNTVIEDSSVSKNSIIDCDRIEDSIVFEENKLESGTNINLSILGEQTEIRSGSVLKQAFIGGRSFIDMNNSIRGVKFVPDARTDLSEISK